MGDPRTLIIGGSVRQRGCGVGARQRMVRATPEDAGSVALPSRPPEPKEVIESKLIPCERCGAVVAMLIFAPNATDSGQFEDYARKMYPHYNHLNVPTWIIGPALGEGPLIDRPADVLKVWPAREPIQRLPSAQFNSLLDQFVTRHCHLTLLSSQMLADPRRRAGDSRGSGRFLGWLPATRPINRHQLLQASLNRPG